MDATALELEQVINEYLLQLNAFPEEEASYKPVPARWSKKEIIGHLIDSAQNNIRRFIAAQYEENPKIVYNQDKWVELNHWQEFSLADLINLWYLLNKQICSILKNTDTEMAGSQVQTEALHSIEWLAMDYIKHLKHHLNQVLNLSPVAYP